MSDAKHTPGPWLTDDHETHWSVLTDSGQHIADVRSYTDGLTPLSESDANARLVAASPALLAALDNLINACKDLPAFYAGRTPCIELSLAMEAVAKAKGG